MSFIFAAVVPLAVASVAWACGVLATLKLDTRSASAGQSVNAVGVNYSTAAGASAVTIHLGTRNGRVLGTTVPNAGRQIAASFPVPSGLRPGWYVVMATQFLANGTPVAGTPGRTTLHVLGSTAHRAHRAFVAAPWSSSTPPGAAPSAGRTTAQAGGSGGTSALVLGAAVVLSLTLLAGGLAILTGRRLRTSKPLRLGA